MQKTSVKAAVRQVLAEEKRAAKTPLLGAASATTLDSFTNFAQKMGVGADNPLSTARYGFNPVTRNRIQLEWVHRGSWLGGLAIDIPADDMTRAGADISCEMPPDDSKRIDETVTALGVWDALGDCIRWGRLYGGAIAVMLVQGQDLRTPLRKETVGPDQFKGLLVLDRWMLEPVLDDLVTEYGPDLGLPKYYRVMANAPALRGQTIHYTRIALRHVGVPLPYQQGLSENMWGLSVIERLWDRMTMFDSASTGAGQLVYKAWLRTLKIKDLRSVVAAGNKPLEGLMKYVDVMRRYQNMEGISMLDAEDELEVQEHGAFSGLADVVSMFAQHVSGALQIPLTRMLGQSPKGLGNEGESDLRTYYDGINQQQNRLMRRGVLTVFELTARSLGIEVPKDFGIEFASLWQMTNTEKATFAKDVGEAVGGAYEKGLITQQAGMKELRQVSRTTGIFSNITAEEIEQAEAELSPPDVEDAAPEDPDPNTLAQHEHEAGQADLDRKHEIEKMQLQQRHDLEKTKMAQKHQATLADKTLKSKEKEARNAARPNGQARPVGGGARQRNRL